MRVCEIMQNTRPNSTAATATVISANSLRCRVHMNIYELFRSRQGRKYLNCLDFDSLNAYPQHLYHALRKEVKTTCVAANKRRKKNELPWFDNYDEQQQQQEQLDQQFNGISRKVGRNTCHLLDGKSRQSNTVAALYRRYFEQLYAPSADEQSTRCELTGHLFVHDACVHTRVVSSHMTANVLNMLNNNYPNGTSFDELASTYCFTRFREQLTDADRSRFLIEVNFSVKIREILSEMSIDDIAAISVASAIDAKTDDVGDQDFRDKFFVNSNGNNVNYSEQEKIDAGVIASSSTLPSSTAAYSAVAEMDDITRDTPIVVCLLNYALCDSTEYWDIVKNLLTQALAIFNDVAEFPCGASLYDQVFVCLPRRTRATLMVNLHGWLIMGNFARFTRDFVKLLRVLYLSTSYRMCRQLPSGVKLARVAMHDCHLPVQTQNVYLQLYGESTLGHWLICEHARPSSLEECFDWWQKYLQLLESLGHSTNNPDSLYSCAANIATCAFDYYRDIDARYIDAQREV